jgi:hypothetical protein
MNKSSIKSCGRADDIVAYMYGELGSDERGRFEKHLADCMSCIDEFAAVSDARFSVYEWNKEEFVPLATPVFSIPYTPRPAPSIGFFAAIGEMIRGAGWPVPVAASLVLCAGLVFAAMIFTGTGSDQIARVEVEDKSQTADPSVAELPEIVEPVIENTKIPAASSGPAITQARRIQPQSVDRNMKQTSRKSDEPRIRTELLPVVGKAPVLSGFEENDDRSLRLSDLLDEIGG